MSFQLGDLIFIQGRIFYITIVNNSNDLIKIQPDDEESTLFIREHIPNYARNTSYLPNNPFIYLLIEEALPYIQRIPNGKIENNQQAEIILKKD